MDALVGSGTDFEVAARLGLSTTVVWRRRHVLGRGSVVPSVRPEAWWLRREYVMKRRTGPDIALELGVSSSAVYKWLIDFDIPRRARAVQGIDWANRGAQFCVVEGCGNLRSGGGRKCSKHARSGAGSKNAKAKIPNDRCSNCGWAEGPCHRHRLEAGGRYNRGNVAVLCPNCHSLAHLGKLRPRPVSELAV